MTSASYHVRDLSSSGSSSGGLGTATGVGHHGVVVGTDKGNSYLIHHPGPGGLTTVTSASHMSKAWSKTHDIPVSGSPTVQAVYNGAGGRTTIPAVSYATAGTCIGAAKGAERTLSGK